MSGQYLMGIDNGGTSIKAGIYDLSGGEIATAHCHVTQYMPHDGWLERSIDEVWAANRTAIRGALEKSGIDPGDLLGVATTGYANGAFFFGADKKPAAPNCILSGDMRAKDSIKRWYSDGTVEKNVPKTCQSLWAGQLVPLMAWMKDHCPDVFSRTRYVLCCKDFLRLCLTGEIAGEVSDSSTISGLDLYTRRFEPALFENLGIPGGEKLLPERILGSGEIGGYVSAEAAALTGLREGTPVMGGLTDIDACCIATGVTDPDTLCVILGTWGICEAIGKTPIAAPDFFMTSLYCMEGYYLHTEGSTTSASNLQWFVDHFMEEEAREAKARGADVYDVCEAMLEATPYDDSSVIFLPFLYGTNVNLDAKAGFVGLSGRHTKAHMLRAVYEGILFSHMYHTEKLVKYRGADFRRVRISGGGAGSAQWVQMFSDALGLPVEVPAAKELGSMGAAICAAVGAGVFQGFEEAAAVFARVKKVYTPDPARGAYYRTKYGLYKRLIEALDGVWDGWSGLEK